MPGQRARRRRPARRPAGEAEAHFEVTGELDEYSVAALRLEIDELARRLGATITMIELEKAEDKQSH